MMSAPVSSSSRQQTVPPPPPPKPPVKVDGTLGVTPGMHAPVGAPAPSISPPAAVQERKPAPAATAASREAHAARLNGGISSSNLPTLQPPSNATATQTAHATPAVRAMSKQSPSFEQVKQGSQIQRGQSGTSVKEMQGRLSDLGYGVQQTGQFGNTTETRVKQFQRDHGVQMTGKMGPTTATALDKAEKHAPTMDRVEKHGAVIKHGMQGEAVKEMQQRLSHLGYGVQQTGMMGNTTEKALKQFQKDHHIQQTGRLGRTTLDAMRQAERKNNPEPLDQHAVPHPNNYGLCGVTTTAMALKANGKNVDLGNAKSADAFASKMYTPGEGSSGELMAKTLREEGLKDAQFKTHGTMGDLTGTLDKGQPVPLGVASTFGGKVTNLPHGSTRYPELKKGDSYEHTYGSSGHWLLTTGYKGDAANPTSFTVNDPDTGATVEVAADKLRDYAGGDGSFWLIKQ